MVAVMAGYAAASPVDSLFMLYERTQKANIAHQLIDSFSVVYDCYDYPVSHKQHSNERLSKMLVYLGMANHSYNKGQFYNAERLSNTALTLAPPDSLRWLSSCYEVLNVAQQRVGEFQKALQNAKLDYEIGQKLNNPRIMSSALNSMATINIATGHPNEALAFIDKAIDLERENTGDNGRALAIRLGIKCEALMGADRADEALQCIDEAIQIDSINGRMNKYNIRKSQKADILLHQKKWTECKNICLKTFESFRQSNDIVNEIITLKQLGMCDIGAKNYASAEKYLLEGEALCKKIGFNPLLWRIQEQLSKLYESTHQMDKAMAYLLDSHAIKDSLNSEKYQKLLGEYQIEYETHQKEEQIERQSMIMRRYVYIGAALLTLLVLLTILTVVAYRLAHLRKLSNEMLEENNIMQNQILTIVSHDLRNPVNAQKQMLDYICNSYDIINEEDRKNMITQVQMSNSALSDLLSSLLEWASLESGRMEYKPIRVNLASIVNSSLRQVNSMCKKYNVTILKSVPDNTFVFADIGFLEIIIRNLLVNAIKYSYSDGIVEVEAKDSGNHITLYVVDHGKGMLPEEKEFIFKKEFVTTPGTHGETGTGIGLMVCKELVEKSGCTIAFDSVYMKGSSFYFTIHKCNTKL